jgi:cysteine desulfurase
MFFKRKKIHTKRIYLDYASATPVRPEVMCAMLPYFTEQYGNAGSIHTEGVVASNAIESRREKLALVFHVRSSGIIFTASGTESNNLAIMGIVEARHKEGIPYREMEVVSTDIEHASVREVLVHLSSLGVTVVTVSVNHEGIIETEVFKNCLTPRTILVTYAYVNSEVGVIQPLGKLARIVRAYEKEVQIKICVHVDAAQAPLWLPCARDSLLADIISLDAGKCYGPKGVGVLVQRHDVALEPYLFGGGQEGGHRPGTLNTPLIIGAVESICIAQNSYKERSARVTQLRDTFIQMLLTIDGVVLNGSPTERVANNVNISIAGIDSEFAVISLDEKGVACATKSACGGAKGDGSAVVRTITNDEARARTTIRFSLGEETTQRELEQTVEILRLHVQHTKHSLTKLTVS